MKIIFSMNAKERMQERQIRRFDVETALLSPKWFRPTFGERIYVEKEIEGRMLEVVYTKSGETYTVITCYML